MIASSLNGRPLPLVAEVAPAQRTTSRAPRLNPLWMRVAEVAESLDVSERTVWKWEAVGKIPKAIRKGKKWTRWRRSDIESYLSKSV